MITLKDVLNNFNLNINLNEELLNIQIDIPKMYSRYKHTDERVYDDEIYPEQYVFDLELPDVFHQLIISPNEMMETVQVLYSPTRDAPAMGVCYDQYGLMGRY